jgi:hypothetical protein
VQEWKDVLLRGSAPDMLDKYWKGFLKDQQTVREQAQALQKDVKDDEARKLIDGFLTAHEAMSQKYQAARDAFTTTGGKDFASADKMVKGQDRPPTDSIDKLVERLRMVVNDRREARLAEVRRGQKLATALIVVVFTALIVVGVVGGRRLVAPIEQAMQALREGAAQTTSAAGEVASSAQTLSQGATEQAASLEATSASMEESQRPRATTRSARRAPAS